jgi:L-alanine-DL-glutamate epimerase-like enolase superfamily enzyme
VDYIPPDVCHAGGILELKKIGILAETYRVNMAPHNPQSYVSTLASLHVDASTPSAVIQESTLKSLQIAPNTGLVMGRLAISKTPRMRGRFFDLH